MKPTLPLAIAAGLVFSTVLGCDNGRAGVMGNVTYRGKPVESGSINFEPVDGKGGTAGGSIEDGKFALDGDAGVFPGKKKVNILIVQKTGKQVPAGPPYPADAMIEEIKSIQLPPQEAEVVAGQPNTFDFKVE